MAESRCREGNDLQGETPIMDFPISFTMISENARGVMVKVLVQIRTRGCIEYFKSFQVKFRGVLGLTEWF